MKQYANRITLYVLSALLITVCGSFVEAATSDDLQKQIAERNSEIEQLEEEIAEYRAELQDIGERKQTLDNEIRQLELTQRKLEADQKVTERRITQTESRIQTLGGEIDASRDEIADDTTVLARSVRRLYELESRSLAEVLFAHKSFSAFLENTTQLMRFQSRIKERIISLEDHKRNLEDQREELSQERKRLLALTNRLEAQQRIARENEQKTEELLQKTKSKEENYQRQLEERLERKEALEREIERFERQLRVEIDPDALPPAQSGVLRWPLGEAQNASCWKEEGKGVENCLTQYFGNTSFSTKNPQVYNGSGHNGVDFRATVGTPVLAAAGGEVVDTGNTDNQCYGVSYGKWVLIRHYNGLTTLYAHLSLIDAAKGQKVSVGDTIGYSGNSGYSTGPHLHFTVFASKAVRVSEEGGEHEYVSRVCGTYLHLPLSSHNGYLNPLSYLPL